MDLGLRVLSSADAVATLHGLFPTVPRPPPLVRAEPAHALDVQDPIFESLREDYPPFDEWFTKCRRQQRQTWTIRHLGRYGGLCIVNPETPAPYGLRGKTPKICTFKVARDSRGHRYGELLLKALFEFMYTNDYEAAFVEVYEKHADLIELFQDSGFGQVAVNDRCDRPFRGPSNRLHVRTDSEYGCQGKGAGIAFSPVPHTCSQIGRLIYSDVQVFFGGRHSRSPPFQRNAAHG